MDVFRRLPPADQRADCALTIGNYDGVHRGHQAVLARLVERARERHCDWVFLESGLGNEAAHRFFHRQMVHSVSRGLGEEQREALFQGLLNLHDFFRNQEQHLDVLLPQFKQEGQDS